METAEFQATRKVVTRAKATMEIVEYKFGGVYLTVKIPLKNGMEMVEELYAEDRTQDFWLISRTVGGKPTYNTARDTIYPVSNRVRLAT